MNMQNIAKTFVISLLALVVVLVATTSVAADPYDGVNTIGTYYQYTNTVHYNYQNSYQYQGNYQGPGDSQYYDYVAPPRAGGWFGSGTEWLVGLRSPVYTPVPPVHYTNYYQQVYGNSAWFGGGYGYPRATANDFPYRTRLGGVFGY